MLNYLIKRLLLFFVTLFGISIIQFAIINSMPGRPSGQNKVPDENQKVEALTSDSDRKWRASYRLDKPILLNTRPWMKRKDVEKIIIQRVDGVPYDKMQAEWELDDWGQSAVPFLVQIANDESVGLKYRTMCLNRLSANIKRLKKLPSPNLDVESEKFEKLIKWNQSIVKENLIASKHDLKKTANPSLAQVNKHAQWWEGWFEEHRAKRFDYDGELDKVKDLFFDTRYSYYCQNLAKLDFGETRNKTRVIDEIADALPVTLILNAISFLIIYMTALPIGILGALRRAGLFDVSSTVLMFLLYSLPTFYIGMIMLSMTTPQFPDWLDFLPSRGWQSYNYEQMTTLERFWDRAVHSVMPLFCMVYGSLAYLSRFARTSILDIIQSDYIRTARAKGLSEWVVVMKHAIRNAALPVLTLLGSMLPGLFGGSIIIEVIFQLQGVNKLFFDSITGQDYATVSAIMLISAVLVLINLFIVDFLYVFVDPRISYDD